MTTCDRAAFSPAGGGNAAFAFGHHKIRIFADATGGNLGCFESEVPPGEGPPPHIHDRETEFFRVVEGRFLFSCGEDQVTLAEGGVIAVPPGAVHWFRNVGSGTGRLMVVVTLGGFEGFFPAVERENPQTPEAIDALAARFSLRFVPALAAQAA
jgi:mannose-6-phosphate isomerase-like protein (cupin superfamily)